MNDDNDGVVKCQKNSTTPPRCHSDQVDPLVYLGPGFWATARNRPKMAQNLKIELLPQFYSQDSPLFRL